VEKDWRHAWRTGLGHARFGRRYEPSAFTLPASEAAMKHIVVDGDCIQSIAAQYGFADGSDIWNDPQNASLKQLRGDGNQLHPGDKVSISKPKPKEFNLATGKRHKVVVPRPKRLIRLRFLDEEGKPMSGDYVFKAGDLERTGALDGDGVLEQKIPADITRAEVTIGQLRRTILIGHLNPLSDTDDNGTSGAQARLVNLGYATGEIDGQQGPMTQAALREFQADHDLDVTGELDDDTIAKLNDEHGC
jgi:N-acetylmuramoyl-L-alanine amidase